MHRYLLGLTYGDERRADHRNHDTLDNTDDNLRIATHHQNNLHRVKRAKSQSGFKGVAPGRRKDRTTWYATLTFRGNHYFLGVFNSAEDAARAYDRKAIEMFGDFAWTNFPVEDYR